MRNDPRVLLLVGTAFIVLGGVFFISPAIARVFWSRANHKTIGWQYAIVGLLLFAWWLLQWLQPGF